MLFHWTWRFTEQFDDYEKDLNRIMTFTAQYLTSWLIYNKMYQVYLEARNKPTPFKTFLVICHPTVSSDD